MKASTRQRLEAFEQAASTRVARPLVIIEVMKMSVVDRQADQARSLAPGESRSLELSRYYNHQADRAHRRFLASVESLARVRRLMAPIAQINIGRSQVNVAGNVTTGKGNGSSGDAS